MSRVNLRIEAVSRAGEALARDLETFRDLLACECGCPENMSCEVVIEETARDRYDVIIIRSGWTRVSDEWFVILGDKDCRYIRSFAEASAEDLVAAILDILEKPLTQLLV